MYKKIKQQVHFIGIGGIGMSGIAEVLARQGFPITGSDLISGDTTRRLQDLGIKIYIGHDVKNVEGASVVVFSSAVRKDNPEYLEAQRQGIPLVPRAEMLAELMRLKFGLAIAGTHGKTTTTSMLASILASAGLDPTIIVGGKVDALGGNAKLGDGKFIVAEADESDGSFLRLSPVVNIITNIDNDHLDFYGRMETLRLAFLEFANKIPYYGRSIVCIDDPEIQKLIPLFSKPYWTYGFSEDAHFQIKNYKTDTKGIEFEIYKDKKFLCDLEIHAFGKHNARNATATVAAAIEIDLELEEIKKGLSQYKGVRRRFEFKKDWNGVTVVDDYGHHPTEISATIQAAQNSFKSGRIVVVFQPHRYSRTQICWNQFSDAFKSANQVFLVDVYPAGEAAISGISSELLSKKLNLDKIPCQYVGDLKSSVDQVKAYLRPGDLLITLGAGSITQFSGLM